MNTIRKQRILIFIVAYYAESTIRETVQRIPTSLLDDYEVDILIIDDSSRDKTFQHSYELARRADIPFKIRVLFNPVNQGYGGNQKLGYRYAIEHGYDFVALLHGDGQYAPECLPSLLKPLSEKGAAAVFGSRMMTPNGALRGGMPLYKFLGNKILTWIQNQLLRTNLTEFHSGYRIYSVEALKAIPFERNSNDFHFDTEIIIQLVIAKRPIIELPIPTFYGNEICRVNGIPYAVNVIKATLRARLQEWSLFYDRRYDCAPVRAAAYPLKLAFESPHSFAFHLIPRNSTVVDLGCAEGHLAAELKRQKQCRPIGVNRSASLNANFDEFHVRDLNQGMAGLPLESADVVLLLDVIEHLASPERFLEELRDRVSHSEIVISTGNVAFIVTRLMLLFGQFNYGKRGILDLTHTRLFTLSSLRNLLEQAGFSILETRALPAPYPLAIGDNTVSRLLLKVNSLLNRISPRLFGYQLIVRAKALPTVGSLLHDAHEVSDEKVRLLDEELVAN